MPDSASDLWRVLGSAARVWARPDLLEVHDEWWTAFSGQRNVNYNVACCHSARPEVLRDHCLQPTLDLKKPAIVMLAGPGLATAQKLVEVGWVDVGALPLMTRTGPVVPPDGSVVRELPPAELAGARALLADTYGLDDASARAAVPDRASESGDMGVWGLYDDDRLESCVTVVVEDGLMVVWSMATWRRSQGRGYGQRLLRAVLAHHAEAGVSGSLLQSSLAGQTLYRGLGYAEVEHWQLWSRPRWVMANA